MSALEQRFGVGNVRLEYGKRLSAKEVGRLTRWKRREQLQRFKIVCTISP